ncbi:hypothetical protein TF3313_0727 [Tannerella forsythia 3313]|nr:hypothetical protein TF3313_0727 [Tannerella forsythia 3313]
MNLIQAFSPPPGYKHRYPTLAGWG